MTGASLLPCLASLAALIGGFILPERSLLVGGILGTMFCAGMITLAQQSPACRSTALIVMVVISCMMVGAVAVTAVVIAIIYAACASGGGP